MPEEHWNRQHHENLSLDCYGCDLKFPSRQALDWHLERRGYKCPFGCRQSFVHHRELVSHEKTCGGKLVTFPPQILDRVSYSNCYKDFHKYVNIFFGKFLTYLHYQKKLQQNHFEKFILWYLMHLYFKLNQNTINFDITALLLYS